MLFQITEPTARVQLLFEILHAAFLPIQMLDFARLLALTP
jgi:hypothetical protein